MKAPSESQPERRAEYVEARRVLLDALEALGPQRRALVLAGAQAIYVHTGPAGLAMAEHTTDGDLALDPSLLKPSPPLVKLMEEAGFELARQGEGVEPGIWHKTVRVNGIELPVPIDLIVPMGVAGAAGRRGARLGPHGKRAARKIAGLEAALVDNDEVPVGALEAADTRCFQVRVAGPAALLVAKAHKLRDRIDGQRAWRLDDKDALDVFRLMQTTAPTAVGRTLARLREDPIASKVTEAGIEELLALFGTRAGEGIAMAARALRAGVPHERVRAVALAYCDGLRDGMA